MNRISIILTLVLIGAFGCSFTATAQAGDLRIVLIRHGEKPLKGGGLTCQGINRSRELVPLLYGRFGVPAAIYVPNKGKRDTERSRMYQTILPFASKYRLAINSVFHEDEIREMVKEIRGLRGVVLVVWEHSGLPAIAGKLGVEEELKWKDSDFDGMWIVRYENGRAVLTKDREGLKPGEGCP